MASVTSGRASLRRMSVAMNTPSAGLARRRTGTRLGIENGGEVQAAEGRGGPHVIVRRPPNDSRTSSPGRGGWGGEARHTSFRPATRVGEGVQLTIPRSLPILGFAPSRVNLPLLLFGWQDSQSLAASPRRARP